MGVLATICEVLTLLGGIIGTLSIGWVLISLSTGATNDITLAAVSAFAAAITLIPYCIGGAFHRSWIRRA